MLARIEDSVLIVIDMQPSFLDGVWRNEEVLNRTKFIVECATILGVPILATEQYRERMGASEPSLATLIGSEAMDKMTFSCCGIAPFTGHLDKLGKKQVVLAGIETHICVNQTAHHLVGSSHEVIVCADAVSARTEDRHKIGLKRLCDLGATLAHTESVVYEWIGSAADLRFREILALVKKYAST